MLPRQRRADRYGSDLRPGHPLYERIRREVLEEVRHEAELDEESVLESLNDKLEQMRLREEAVQAMLAEDDCGSADMAPLPGDL